MLGALQDVLVFQEKRRTGQRDQTQLGDLAQNSVSSSQSRAETWDHSRGVANNFVGSLHAERWKQSCNSPYFCSKCSMLMPNWLPFGGLHETRWAVRARLSARRQAYGEVDPDGKLGLYGRG
jgi:hypothetical protein